MAKNAVAVQAQSSTALVVAEEFEQFAAPRSVDNVELKVSEKVDLADDNLPDDLQPGGLAAPAESSKKNVSDASIESPLAGMSIKELRRMAEANGIPGSSDMKKKDLVRALRDKVSTLVNNDAPKEDTAKVLSFDDIGAPDGE